MKITTSFIVSALALFATSCTQAISRFSSTAKVISYCTTGSEGWVYPWRFEGNWSVLKAPPTNASAYRYAAEPSKTLDPKKATYDEKWLQSSSGDLVMCFVGNKNGCYKYVHLFPGGAVVEPQVHMDLVCVD
jgi:hypothetical protein